MKNRAGRLYLGAIVETQPREEKLAPRRKSGLAFTLPRTHRISAPESVGAERARVPRITALVKTSLRACLRIVRMALREIFDESAYDRFLARSGAPRSAASYRQFLREQEETTVRRPRCC